MGERTLINPQSVAHLYNIDSANNKQLYHNNSTSSKPTNYSSNTYRSTLNSTSTLNTNTQRKNHFKHPSCVNLFPQDSPTTAINTDLHTTIDFFESDGDIVIQTDCPLTLSPEQITLKNKASVASSIQRPKLVHKQSSSETIINEFMDNVNKTIFQDLLSFSQYTNSNNTPNLLPPPARYSCDSEKSRDFNNTVSRTESYGFPRRPSTLSLSIAKFKELVKMPSSSNMERAVTSTTYKCDASEISDYNSQIQLQTPPPYTIPPGSILFVTGFIFFPCWWIGSKYPKSSNDRVVTKDDIIFKKLNFYMSLFSIPLLMLIIGCLIWYFVAY
ncbi:hypothetical protein CONCODRAFT_77409 [Conidiobolus coronatus NRRL 28638]|uniref:Uncharacterized protein n=1 Tax=Conidiobolus coronatus (strain ATCC 28846 / CBS 209.66 / NRRL 28638) TaxID=796925 RepID=A0A137PEC5_CONC2|nr:hypothetical protein CONCODRAFT_77409 [Conidiobolus coronatus NRRL 28638]|eukprot:KXN73364.1 hypothetical protein CONCODRAFT_77409 [Conidiobolus coronatus NRRL 28638]